MLRTMPGVPTTLLLAVVACSHPAPKPEPLSQVARPSSSVAAAEVPALSRAFYNTLGVIHATSDEPDADDTPLLASLQPCQIEPARPLEHPGFKKFFPALQFFVSSCKDGSYAVVSIDGQRNVRLVSLEPHERLAANAWDEATSGPVVIANPDDVRLFGSAFGALTYLQTVSPSRLTVHEKSGTDQFAGTHYYEVEAPTYEVTIASDDKRNYSVASTGRSTANE